MTRILYTADYEVYSGENFLPETEVLVEPTISLLAACERRSAPPPPSGPARLVSLTPSATEIVAALGATKELVGVDEYSTFPPEVAALPKVGSFLQPNLEAIVMLAPTLVIVDDIHGQAAGALRDQRIPTIECPIHALPDVKKALRAVFPNVNCCGTRKAAGLNHRLIDWLSGTTAAGLA